MRAGRVGASALAASALVAALAACGHDDAAEPDAVDAARLHAVATDPALAGAAVHPADTRTGSTNFRYRHAKLHLDGGTWAQADARIARLRAEGWRLAWASCGTDDDAAGTWTGQVVLLARTYAGLPGGPADVVLAVTSSRADAADAGRADVVGQLPHHLDTARTWQVPSTSLQPAATCLAQRPSTSTADGSRATATSGQRAVLSRTYWPAGLSGTYDAAP